MLRKSSTTFLKFALLIIATPILAGLLYFPQVEGRATNLNQFEIYSDPFIIYIYIASISFFIGIYQAIKLLGLIEQNKAFTQAAVKRLRNMKLSALALMFFIIGALPVIFPFAQEDDVPGVVLIALVAILTSAVLATACAVFQKLFQNALDLKEENELTV